ncbi:DEAD/DEAH box helicase [Macrococcoides caseolyticum]|uniref:DEAD/DEAH box helicase n=1 Tax=Macrococcoides caseolyticum TaxID=69966 RepID=UPI001F21DE82|nr:DEAD/DEAH box helicase [Macrococcus caseolyticus]MCE4955850.1 DEAD/DEAH box helicase family protein [Macrococcus caseolyticus]
MKIIVSDIVSEIKAIQTEGKMVCNYCLNEDQLLFHSYFHQGYQQKIVYCRCCITASVHSLKFIHLEKTRHQKEEITVTLPFELTKQQKQASAYIVKQIKQQQSCLLYAVTGAGKTEMILDGICHVRDQGGNVAVVSPRTDVVKELSLRLNQYLDTEIATLYGGHNEMTSDYFIISTIHQLIHFDNHFDLIIVDEIDAFPVGHDPRLMKLLNRALSKDGSFVYLSATPPKHILDACQDRTLYLPLRYHQRPLPVPQFKYLNHHAIERTLNQLLKNVVHQHVILIFFHDIQLMEACYNRLDESIQKKTVCVYSNDSNRHDKVSAIRDVTYQFVFTTTILERGFTMYGLSAWVLNSHRFKSDSLIQIAGRVDRKGTVKNGEVIYFHDGISLSMIHAVKAIKKMNARGKDVS